MPRIARLVIPNLPHHITQRGNYRQKVFYRDEDRLLYLELLRQFSMHYGVSIQAYALMPNHVHVIAVPHEERALGLMFQRVHSDYARALHLRLRRVKEYRGQGILHSHCFKESCTRIVSKNRCF